MTPNSIRSATVVVLLAITVSIAFTGTAAGFAAVDGAGHAVDAGGADNVQTTSDNESHNHSDDPPENNPNPDDPPCDADHGHPDNQSEECNGEDGDNGNGNGELGTCEQDGLVQNNTVANEAFGTENEDGPISSEIHANEGQFQDAELVVHEGSCVVATVDNNAPAP